MIRSLLLVGTGSFVGGALRYLLSWALRPQAGLFPFLGTLAANLLGCLLIGLLYGLAQRHTALPKDVVLMLTTGLCGGFTTFSTFANEGLLLLESHQPWTFAAYAGVSIGAGLALVFSGYQLARLF